MRAERRFGSLMAVLSGRARPCRSAYSGALPSTQGTPTCCASALTHRQAGPLVAAADPVPHELCQATKQSPTPADLRT